ncbi:ABC-F type ribosomal protection protein [Caloramator sp. E03]|uniref:ribosomal protection-like ABC-F family protein n=1 Tax=Caloramator sp. E03 TaxID=2576307 RepID=UPI001110916F|nr:ABC-F type ribosomal protection protein [Caloramator sp. E03]QCX34031.1 ABC-F type ribosomal protection protein [Caloramator sp. E03]
MIALSLNKIQKSYGIEVILKDITFAINEYEKVGLVGPNGAGKTTLFKIICNELKPDSGDIFIGQNKKIGYLSQNLDLDENLTVFEETMNVFSNIKNIENRLRELEILMSKENFNSNEYKKLLNEYGHLQEEYERNNGYGCESFAKGMLIGLGISNEDFSKKIANLSGGQKTRVALSKLLLSNPDILLLDEPTNHLDLDAIQFLENFLKEYKGTVLIISHDRYFLDEITNKTFELNNGIVEEYNGNYSFFIAEREKRLEQSMKEYSLQQKEIKRLEEIIERYRSFNREKSIKQAESREKALERIQRLEKPLTEDKTAKIKFDVKYKSGNDVLIVEDLSKSFNDKTLFTNLSFMIKRGEKTALVGENGRGKTTLFKMICGKLNPDNGMIRLGKNVYIGYYDQEQKDLSPDKMIIDEIWDDYPNLTITQVRNYLAAFLFTGNDVFKKVESLSGGEKCRLSLLKLMLSKANFLLLDEPTNHLDILSREALEKALLEYEGTLFVISHDRYFLNKVINKILEMEDGNITEYLGNFQYYISKKNSNQDEIIVNIEGKTKTEIREEKRKLRELQIKKKQQKEELKKIEKMIEETDLKIQELQSLMCLEETYKDPEKAIKVNKEFENTKKILDELYQRWEELLIEVEE